MHIHAHFYWMAILTRKVGQADLFLVCQQSSLVGRRTQDYKSLRAAATICTTPVNMETNTHTEAQPAEPTITQPVLTSSISL